MLPIKDSTINFGMHRKQVQDMYSTGMTKISKNDEKKMFLLCVFVHPETHVLWIEMRMQLHCMYMDTNWHL